MTMAKIIVVDDEGGVRRATRHALQAGGYDVVEFDNGGGAIAHLVREPADLLITDIFMPETEGLETIRRARALRPAMPIIAISGFFFESRDYLEMAEKMGAAASLKKPFRPVELLDLVARLLADQGD
jgi:DNA-binding NtrC family response regulator